jgi:hypothetical protein
MYVQSVFGRITSVLSVTLVVFAAAATIEAQDEFGDGTRRGSERTYQIGLRLSYRIDELSTNRYTPSSGVRILYYPARWVAFSLGLNYNSHAELSDRASSKSMLADYSLRFHSPGKRVSPFIEVGYAAPKYWVTTNGARRTVSDHGLRAAAGLSFHLGARHSLDLTLSQLLNHVGANYVVLDSYTPAPCPPGVDCDFQARVPEDTYNQADLELMYRFGL